MGAHLQRYPSTALHCTPHFPTVNAPNPPSGPTSPLKAQVGAVERSGGQRGGKWGGEWATGGRRRGRFVRVARSAKKDVLCLYSSQAGTLRGPGHPAGLVVRVSAFEEATWYWTPDGKRVAPSMIWCRRPAGSARRSSP